MAAWSTDAARLRQRLLNRRDNPRSGGTIRPMSLPDRHRDRFGASPPTISLVDEPERMTQQHRPSPEKLADAKRQLQQPLTECPYHFVLGIMLPDGRELRAQWYRMGLSAGIIAWVWQNRMVAATVLLNGFDIDDCDALLHLSKVPRLSISSAYLQRLRDQARPLAGTAYLHTEPILHPFMARYIGAMAEMFGGHVQTLKLPLTTRPLGAAMRRDFPPRFAHLSFTYEGKARVWVWITPEPFQAVPDFQQVLMTFATRLRESFSHFEEHLLLNRPEGQRRIRVVWRGIAPSSGIATLQESSQGVEQVLLLLSKKNTSEQAAIQEFKASVARTPMNMSAFQAPLRDIANSPRPLLACLTSIEPAQVDPTVMLAARGLAAAYFRLLGVF